MLRVDGLSKRLGAREVLRGVGFSVQAAEIFGLLGNNGSGKTTTMNVVGGLLTPDAGTVTLSGESSLPLRRRRLGFAPQEAALYPTLTCEENLQFFARLYGLRSPKRTRMVASVIDQFGLTPYRDARVDTLSGGWKRRLNLAVALVHEPAVVLLDEPTAGLDVEARALVWERLRQLRAKRCGVLLTTHAIEEAERLCDRLGILVDGRVVAQGSLAELRTIVPAAQIASVECDNWELLQRRARELGLELRSYEGRRHLLLPARTTIAALSAELGEVGLHSLALEPVSLLHVFLEVVAKVRPPGLEAARDGCC